jgi:Right handed beta helix region
MESSLRLTIGPREGDLRGTDDRVLQAGVDYLAALGGGTLRILPGEYRLNNAVHLRSGIRVEGSGPETVLLKNPSVQTRLAADADWYEQEIELADASGFEMGYGVVLQARHAHHEGRSTQKRTLVAQDGNRFRLDRLLEENFWVDRDAEVATLFPLLTGNEVHDIEIRSLTLDGDRPNNERLDGNYAGCIFLQNCHTVRIEEVTARNYHGDGISWQICHDVAVLNCCSVGNTDLGLHPGSGSQRPVMRGNHLEGNHIGIFFCWGVKHGVAEENTILDSRAFGISIGHRDTDNVIRGNRIERSGQASILFRTEPNEGRCPHRNQVERNLIVDSGTQTPSYAVDIQGETREISLRGNQFVETRGPEGRVGVRIGPKAGEVVLEANEFSGFETPVLRD